MIASTCTRVSRLAQLAGVALGGLLVALGPGSAHALTYTSGDLVTTFVNGGNEFIVDLGPLTSLTTSPIILSTGGVLGATGASGGFVTAFETKAPFSGSGRTIVFTTDPTLSPLPPAYDNNAQGTLPTYTAGIQAGQAALDAAGTPSGGGWLQNLSGITSGGTGVLLVTSATLGLNASTNPSSYTTVLGLGTNQLGNNLPFSTATNVSTTPQVVDLWSADNTSLNHSTTSLLGTLTVTPNPAGNGSQVELTFSPVPEPGTLVLIAAGLSGLVWVGGRRRTE